MSIQRLAKDEYQRRELYNIFYEFQENSGAAFSIIRTCKPCKKKAQEAGLGVDQVEPEKMQLLIEGYQALINCVYVAKKKLDTFEYPPDNNFDFKLYNDRVNDFHIRQAILPLPAEAERVETNSEYLRALDMLKKINNNDLKKKIKQLKERYGIK